MGRHCKGYNPKSIGMYVLQIERKYNILNLFLS